MSQTGYSKETYLQAKQILERQRLRDEQELEERRINLFSLSPRAMEIEREVAQTSLAAARAVFAGGGLRTQIENLKAKNLLLQKELKDIIESFGLPTDYLEMQYKCAKCRDYGYDNDMMCDCMKSLMRDIEYQKLNEISPLSLSDFSTFSLDYYPKFPDENGKVPYTQMAKVLKFCKRYADGFNEHSGSLFFYGNSGLGKTHLSLAIAKSAIDNGYKVIYVSSPEIFDQIAREQFDLKSNQQNTVQNITQCDLLILDDLGTEMTTKVTISALYRIINSRMLTSKPTIISTNLSSDELKEKYTQRTISRIFGTFEMIGFIGTDIRELKKLGRIDRSAVNG